MAEPKTSLPERVLQWLADLVIRRPQWFLLPQFILFGVCVFYTVAKLEFNVDRNALVGSDKRYHRNFLNFKNEFPAQDDIVAVVESDDHEKNRQFVERLGAKLEAETNLFTDVFYKGDLKMMGTKALLFVPEPDLQELRKTLHDYRPIIETFAQVTNLTSLFSTMNARITSSSREDNAENRALIKALPALDHIVTQASDSLTRPGTPPSPGVNALFGAGQDAESAMYITYDDGRLYLATAHAVSEKVNGDAVERMRVLVRETRREVPGVNVALTGEPVLEYDEMAQSQKDTILATIVSLVLCAGIFIYGYSAVGRPLKATLCLIIGLGYTMGYTTLVVGHLNILTITFAPMLIGLAIDFGVHLITRYEEELRHGRSENVAIHKAMVNTGLGIFTGCFTTAGAFLAMAFTNFKGVAEMGLIAGGGLLICLVPMMTMLPVLLLRGRQNVIDHRPHAEEKRARIERIWLERPGVVSGITLLLCLASASQLYKVYFDYDLLNMQSAGLPAVVFEKKLINSGSNSVLFAAVVATNLTQAAELEKRLTALTNVVSDVKSMSAYLAENQQDKLKDVTAIKKEVAGLKFSDVDTNPVKVEDLSRTLYSSGGFFGQIADDPDTKNDKELQAVLAHLRESIDLFRVRMLAGNRERNGEKLAAFQKALLLDLRETFSTLQNQDDRGRLRVQDLPEALRNRFVGVTGKYLLQVYPREDVWQRANQEKFVSALRTVDPDVTGTPVQLLEYTTLLKDSYVQAAYYALAAIVLLVFIHFRSITCVLLALLPVAVGTLWTVGIMGLCGIPFNPANIMTLPLVIGIGVTNGIHILNRFAEEQSPSILAKSTGKAVLVSALTTIAGFGSLMLAQHQGIQSLGKVMAIGVAMCMLASLTFLPVLLNVLVHRGWTIKKTQRQ